MDPAAANPPDISANSCAVRRRRRYGETINGASLCPRKMTVAAYIDSTLLTPSSRAMAPPMTKVTHWTTRR